MMNGEKMLDFTLKKWVWVCWDDMEFLIFDEMELTKMDEKVNVL